MSASNGDKKGGSSYSQASDANNIAILFDKDVGLIFVLQKGRLKKILRGRTCIRVIRCVP